MTADCMTSLFVAALLLVAGFGRVSSTRRGIEDYDHETTCRKHFEEDSPGSTSNDICSRRGHVKCGETSERFEYCSGRNWVTMCPCSQQLAAGTRSDPGKSCNDIFKRRRGQVESRPYWIAPMDTEYPFQVYCDMKTEGGGWTLVAKVKGKNSLMNRKNTAQWRDGRTIGNTSNMVDENALGLAYSCVSFRDVMIRSIKHPEKYLAWRHSVKLINIQAIVKSCTRIADGVLLNGSIQNLDYIGNPKYHKGCTKLVYGFMGGDSKAKSTSVAGCPSNHRPGHVGAIIGAFLDPPVKSPSERGKNMRCISDFGVGGGFKSMTSIGEKFAINAHYWGLGNRYSRCWRSHAVFIR